MATAAENARKIRDAMADMAAGGISAYKLPGGSETVYRSIAEMDEAARLFEAQAQREADAASGRAGGAFRPVSFGDGGDYA